jgi:hypothetical protein
LAAAYDPAAKPAVLNRYKHPRRVANTLTDRLPLGGPDLERWCETYVAGHALDADTTESAASLAARLRISSDADAEYFGAWQNVTGGT